MDVILCTDVFLNNFYSPSIGIRDYRMLLTPPPPHTHKKKKLTKEIIILVLTNGKIFSQTWFIYLSRKEEDRRWSFKACHIVLKEAEPLYVKYSPIFLRGDEQNDHVFYHKTLILSQNFLQKIQTSAIHLSKSVTKKKFTPCTYFTHKISLKREYKEENKDSPHHFFTFII